MKGTRTLTGSLLVALLLALAVGPGRAQGPKPPGVEPQGDLSNQVALGTAFTYQGRLTDGERPADGTYDFQFQLHGDPSADSPVGSIVEKADEEVRDGLFAVQLDFGDIFDGNALWMEVSVRPGSSDGEYASLAPRQALTAAPYAQYAMDVAPHDHFGESWRVLSSMGVGLSIQGGSTALRGAGGTCGVSGVTSGVGGSGVRGRHDKISGRAYGVEGKSRSDDGYGVYGYNDSSGVGVGAQSEEGVGLEVKSGGSIMRGYDLLPSEDLVFQITNSGDVYAADYHTNGADFAEMLSGAEDLEPGDVLVVGADGELARSATPYDRTVVGVHSTQPGFIGGSDEEMQDPGDVPLAVLGVVPVKASAENGPISPGDLLTTSSTPGHAMRADANAPVGTVIGKALEGWDEGLGVMQMLVMLQ